MHLPISITLPEKLSHSLEETTKELHVSRSALIAAALEDYLFKCRFNRLREKLMIKARAKAIYSDEDVDRRLA